MRWELREHELQDFTDPSGRQTVLGLVSECGHFSVRWVEGAWALSHVPTGKLIELIEDTEPTDTYGQAIRYAEALAPITDWSHTEPTKDPAVLAKIAEVRRAILGDAR